MGFVMAHEVGHNLGMFHDFNKRHGGGGNPCDNSGFMSYGPKVYKFGRLFEKKNQFKDVCFSILAKLLIFDCEP